MSDIYAMQRANGDWFALDDHGRFRVPLVQSRHDALIARSRNFGMLLFKPVALDARRLKEIVPVGSAADVDFWLVNDPLVSLSRGHLVEHAQLVLVLSSPTKLETVPRNGNRFQPRIPTTLPQSDSKATENGEDEGDSYAKCA